MRRRPGPAAESRHRAAALTAAWAWSMFAGMGESQPFRLALHDAHVAAGAEMAERDGWLAPIHYGDAEAEAGALTARAGVFDSSHLGRIRVAGDGALDLLERACTADAATQEDDTALLTAICDEAGVIIDVCFVVRLAKFWVLTTNAAARHTTKIFKYKFTRNYYQMLKEIYRIPD